MCVCVCVCVRVCVCVCGCVQVEDLEMAKGGLTVLSDKARDELPEEGHQSANDAERAGDE